MIDIEKNFQSLSDFKSNTSEFLEHIRGSGNPLMLTVDGEAALVVQDADAYRQLLDRIDKLEALEGIKRGLADVEAGRVTPLREFENEFRARHAL